MSLTLSETIGSLSCRRSSSVGSVLIKQLAEVQLLTSKLHLNTWVFPEFNRPTQLNIDTKVTEIMIYSGVIWECIQVPGLTNIFLESPSQPWQKKDSMKWCLCVFMISCHYEIKAIILAASQIHLRRITLNSEDASKWKLRSDGSWLFKFIRTLEINFICCHLPSI